MTERGGPHLHLDAAPFAESVRYTAATTGFAPRLVEKDYFCTLVRSKLSISGNAAVDVSASRLAALRRQESLGLREVLRPADLAAFDLDRAFGIVADLAAMMAD